MERTIYFEAQTGLIRDSKPSVSNFHQYELPSRVVSILEENISRANVAAGGLEYNPDFLALLPIWERQYRHERMRR